MNTLPAVVPASNVTLKGCEIEVIAETPAEMVAANSALIQWCDHKIEMLQKEHAELEAAYLHAKKCKWQTGTLERQSKLAARRVEFYGRIKSALEAGYYIVPNFPITAFAVRTDRKQPLKMVSASHWNTREQKASGLPTGEGEYKNPFPPQYQREVPEPTSQDQNRKVTEYWAQGWYNLDFPINMVKPRIMEASSRAMALKIFDDLGILPDPNPKTDPMIIARILDPRSTTYRRRFVSFLIAWALDTRTL